MYKVFGLWLGPDFGVHPVAGKNFYLRLTVEKCVPLRFLPKNICGHRLVAAILRLLLIMQIEKLKFKVMPLNCKSLKYKSNL